MIPVSLYPNWLPCKCETVCDFRQSWIDAGSPTELFRLSKKLKLDEGQDLNSFILSV